MLRFSIVFGLIVSCSSSVAYGRERVYDFDDGTFQGWEYLDIFGEPYPVDDSVVRWEVSIEEIDLGENDWKLLQGTSVEGPGTPLEPNYRVIPTPWENRDEPDLTQILRSQSFRLDDSGPIQVDMMGGAAQGERAFDPNVDTPPAYPFDLPEMKSAQGYQGFALYDVADDTYVLYGFPSIINDGKQRDGRGVWETVTIPQEDLAALAGDGKEYTLDVFDSYSGGWGWIGLDTVRIPDAGFIPTNVWVGGGGDNLWSNPANWSLGTVPAGDEVFVNGPSATAPNGPVIQDGIETAADIVISDAGDASMSMTGGKLELSGWGTWWADAAGSTASFTMSGGEIEFTGSPGIMELAWQPDDSPAGSSVGIWEMTGGEVFAKGIDMPGDGEDGNPGSALINLWGGTINVGTERGGLMVYEGGQIDIRGQGQLVLEGEQPQVEDYIDNGWITAYGGEGEIVLEFDGQFTTLTAQGGLPGDCNGDGVVDISDANCTSNDELDDFLASLDPASLRGDADGDGEVQFSDFVILADNFASPGQYTDGDFDKDAEVQFGDFVILADNFGQTGGGVAAAVPEPSSLLLLGMGGILSLAKLRRRRRRVCEQPHRLSTPAPLVV